MVPRLNAMFCKLLLMGSVDPFHLRGLSFLTGIYHRIKITPPITSNISVGKNQDQHLCHFEKRQTKRMMTDELNTGRLLVTKRTIKEAIFHTCVSAASVHCPHVTARKCEMTEAVCFSLVRTGCPKISLITVIKEF